MARFPTLGRFSKILIGIVLGSLIAFIALTWLALEVGGVAILETEGPDGSTRSTHVWFATPDPADALGEGELWVEAGTPGNGWYTDVQEWSSLTLTTTSGGEVSGRYRARSILGEGPHRKIRALLREKYGLRDWWIATLFDTSHSVAVRLTPITHKAKPVFTSTSASTSKPVPTPTNSPNELAD